MPTPRRIRDADGQEYSVGVRWFYDRRYHSEPPARGARDGTRYRIFAPVGYRPGDWYRVFQLDPDAPDDVDEQELARQLRAAGYAREGDEFDSSTRDPGRRPT